MTTWQSDTCNCIIEFTDTQPHKMIKIIRECNTHSHNLNQPFINSPAQKYNADLNRKHEKMISPTEARERTKAEQVIYLKEKKEIFLE